MLLLLPLLTRLLKLLLKLLLLITVVLPLTLVLALLLALMPVRLATAAVAGFGSHAPVAGMTLYQTRVGAYTAVLDFFNRMMNVTTTATA